jgi:hypothetical protein
MKHSNANILLLVILFLVYGIHIVNGQNSKNDARILLKAEDFQKISMAKMSTCIS